MIALEERLSPCQQDEMTQEWLVMTHREMRHRGNSRLINRHQERCHLRSHTKVPRLRKCHPGQSRRQDCRHWKVMCHRQSHQDSSHLEKSHLER